MNCFYWRAGGKKKHPFFSVFFFLLFVVFCSLFSCSSFDIYGRRNGGGGRVDLQMSSTCKGSLSLLFFFFLFTCTHLFFFCVCVLWCISDSKANKEKPLFFFLLADGIGFKRKRKEEFKKKKGTMKRAPVFSVTVTALVVAVDLNWKSSGRCSFFFFPLRQEAGLSPDAWQLLLHLEMNSTVFFFYISWLQEAPTQNWRTARSCRSAFLLHIRVASQNGTAEWGVTQWRSWWRNVWTVITFFFLVFLNFSFFFFVL